MRATGIPHQSRDAMKARSMGRCERCGMRANDAHHRRSRSIRDKHTHCTCNLVHLCRTCHTWAHKHPWEARQMGFIVSRYAEPLSAPFQRWDGALLQPDCDGAFQEPS